MIGKARSWIGVGSVNPIAWVPRTTSGESPKLLNDTGGSYVAFQHRTTRWIELSELDAKLGGEASN
jgi:hypothetical protein